LSGAGGPIIQGKERKEEPMIEVHLEKNEVVGRSVHAAGDLEVRLRVPSDWTTSKRLDLVRLLARWIEEVRIGCTTCFTVVGELATWDEGRILIRLVRRRVAARLLLNSPPPLEKDVQVILEGKENEFGFVLESMIQVATDAPPGLIHEILFNDPPAPPSGWEARVRQRCCARFEQANKDGRLVVGMGMTHGPTGWEPFLMVTKLDERGISWGETWLQGPPLCRSPERWLMEACELAPILAPGWGSRIGRVEWDEKTPWLRFGDRLAFPSLRALADWIQGKRA
jgi:hypothetical protein